MGFVPQPLGLGDGEKAFVDLGRDKARRGRHNNRTAGWWPDFQFTSPLRPIPGAANLGELPARPEITRAHFGVGLEAAGSEHHAFGLHLDGGGTGMAPASGGPGASGGFPFGRWSEDTTGPAAVAVAATPTTGTKQRKKSKAAN